MGNPFRVLYLTARRADVCAASHLIFIKSFVKITMWQADTVFMLRRGVDQIDGDFAPANWHSTCPYWLESDHYWIIMSRGSFLIWISEMGLRLPCPWRSTRRTGSHFLLEQTFLLWYNYEMAKMTIIVKILMRSWILDKASISKCWINIREDENADHQTLIFFIPKRGHMKLQNSRRHFAQCFSFSITCLSPLLRYTLSLGIL